VQDMLLCCISQQVRAYIRHLLRSNGLSERYKVLRFEDEVICNAQAKHCLSVYCGIEFHSQWFKKYCLVFSSADKKLKN
jgi:hypothetical protein